MRVSLLEREIQTEILEYLKALQQMRRLYYVRINAGVVRSKGSFIRLGHAGMSDLIIFLPSKTMFVEIKAERGRQSEMQKEFEVQIKRLGHDYFLIKSFKEFQDMLQPFISGG